MSDLLQRLKTPIKKQQSTFIAPNATAIGDVTLGDFTNIWFGAVLRGDTDSIHIGDRSNIQDNAVIHADPGFPCFISSDCVVGHSAIVHGATLQHHVLVGMHATILNGAEIGEYSVIGANALVPQGMIIPPYSLVTGIPAKIVKTLDAKVEDSIGHNVLDYMKRAQVYKQYFDEI